MFWGIEKNQWKFIGVIMSAVFIAAFFGAALGEMLYETESEKNVSLWQAQNHLNGTVTKAIMANCDRMDETDKAFSQMCRGMIGVCQALMLDSTRTTIPMDLIKPIVDGIHHGN